MFQYLDSQLTAKLLAVQFSVFCTVNQINLSQFKIPRFLFKKSSEYHAISRDSTLHKNQVRLTVSYTTVPNQVFSCFYRSNKFLRAQMDFIYIHISQSTIIQIFKLQFTQTHRQQLKQSTDDPFDQKSQQTVKNEIFCQSPYFVKGFII